MAAGGEKAPDAAAARPNLLAARRARWLGQQYADITKLRELAARHDRAAARALQRGSRINTHIGKLRHQATLLRERSQRILSEIPAIEQQIKQHERDVHEATGGRGVTGPLTSDVTALHYRIRKLQQKVVDRQQKARALELRAAVKNQKTSELKVKVERFNEAARVAEQEAGSFRQRADRLQMISEQEGPGAAAPEPPPAPGSADGPSRIP